MFTALVEEMRMALVELSPEQKKASATAGARAAGRTAGVPTFDRSRPKWDKFTAQSVRRSGQARAEIAQKHGGVEARRLSRKRTAARFGAGQSPEERDTNLGSAGGVEKMKAFQRKVGKDPDSPEAKRSMKYRAGIRRGSLSNWK